MSKFFDGIKILFAKIYNPLPKEIKIGLMALSSLIISGTLTLVVKDLTNYKETVTNEYFEVIIGGFIPFLGIVINVVQQIFVTAGTKILASQGDPATLEKLQVSIAGNRELIKSSK